MAFGDLLQKLGADAATNAALILITVVAVLDFATGSLRAIANSTFTLSAFDVWVRLQLAGRVLPIILVLLAGQVVGNISVGDFQVNVLTAAAFAAAASYVVAGAKSIVDSLNPSAPDVVPTE
jgi:hypothetical protein